MQKRHAFAETTGRCSGPEPSGSSSWSPSTSDIDLMVVSDRLAYADLFAALEKASTELGRKIAPTIYSSKEFSARVKQGDAFVKRVLAQPKLWLIGNDGALAT